MPEVHIADHPLITQTVFDAKKDAPTAKFRQLLNEISMLLGYEVTRDLKLEDVEVETPIQKMMAPQLAGKLVLISILRAGNGLLEGMLDPMPGRACWAVSRSDDTRRRRVLLQGSRGLE